MNDRLLARLLPVAAQLLPLAMVAVAAQLAWGGTWREAVASHPWFGVPAILALSLLSLKVGQHHRRLLAANASLERRVLRRSAELADLSEALDLSATMILSGDGTILHWSRGCERLYGYRAVEMARFGEPSLGDDGAARFLAIREAVARDGEWRGELHQRRKDGAPLVVLSHWMALAGADGPRLVAKHTDITAQSHLQAALAVSEARFRATFDQAAIGMAHVGLDGSWLRVNDRLCAMLGYPRERLLALRFQDTTHPDDLAGDLALVRRLLSGELATYSLEKRYRRADGTLLWARLTVSLLRDPAGRPLHFISTIDDITDRKLAEEHNALLTREVDHRAKNALAVVQAALRLTHAPSHGEFLRAVEGRVAALARAQTALARRRWEGTELRALLEGELEPFLDRVGGPRVAYDGPAVTLPPSATQALCLVVHELATNAVKYGALSVAKGVVHLTWHETAGGLWLRWREEGGPPPASAPARRGFGSRVIEQTVQRQLGGQLEKRWAAAGLICEISLPSGRAPRLATPAETAPAAAEWPAAMAGLQRPPAQASASGG